MAFGSLLPLERSDPISVWLPGVHTIRWDLGRILTASHWANKRVLPRDAVRIWGRPKCDGGHAAM